MRLVNCNRQFCLNIKNGEIAYLIVESEKELRKIISELCICFKEDTDDWVLSEGEEILKKSAVSEIILSPWTVDINSRQLQKALIKRVLHFIHQNEDLCGWNVLSMIQLMLEEINDKMNYQFDYEIESIDSILKECNIHFSKEEDILSELHRYILICSELLDKKLFVLVGIKNYFTNAELEMLSREVGYMECCILCLEHTSDGTEKNMVLIDRDLCQVV